MRKRNLWAMLGLGALALTACSEQDEMTEEDEKGVQTEVEITGSIDGAAKTRVLDNQWEANEKIYVAIGSKLYIFQTSAGDGVFSCTSGDVYLTDKDATYTVKAISPIQIIPTWSNAQFSFQAKGNATPAAQKSWDLMVADGEVSAVNPKVDLVFKRKMARIILNVKTSAADGFKADDVLGGADGSDVVTSTGTISSLYKYGTYTYATDKIAFSGAKEALTLESGTKDAENQVLTYTLIVAPQTLDATYTHSLATSSATNTYSAKLPVTELKAGYSYTFNLTIKKATMAVDAASIESWTEGTGADMDVM